jgi:hypothetical protein
MAETAVQPNNDVRTVMLFKINSWQVPFLN